jgi:hypothetical protein
MIAFVTVILSIPVTVFILTGVDTYFCPDPQPMLIIKLIIIFYCPSDYNLFAIYNLIKIGKILPHKQH